MNENNELKEGNLYRITFLRQSGNGRWYQCLAQAVFIGEIDRPFQHEYLWSFRPVFGTSSIRVECLTEAVLIEENVGGRGATANQISSARQLKSAVPGPSSINKRIFKVVKR